MANSVDCKDVAFDLSLHCLLRPQGYKTYFMLSSAEHEIFSANKYENANNSWHFNIY